MERGERIRIKFCIVGALKYISHLDLLRTMERAIRRSALPIAYTEGFRPRAKLQFASALPVGVESYGELMDLELEEDFSAEEVLARLTSQLPPQLAPQKAMVVPSGESALMSQVEGASYLVQVEPVADLSARVAAWLSQKTIPWIRRQKKKVRHLDLRAATSKLVVVGEDQLELLLFFSQDAINVRPQEIILSLELVPRKIIRTEILGRGVLLGPLEKGKM